MNDCIEFQGSRMPFGYGRVRSRYQGRLWLAHRLAWVKAHGPIPDGLFVLHRCDNPPCINVDHLFLGTKADNTADAVAKGRARGAAGERNSHARLTADDVLAIRDRVARGEAQRALAREYGVEPPAVHKIVRHRTWRHVR